MEIQKIVIADPMYKEIQKMITTKGIKKNIRFLPIEAVSQKDIDWADALASFHLPADFDLSKLKWVHSLGAGVDHFLFNKTWPNHVLLTRTMSSFGQRIAEYCLSYLLKDNQFHEQFQAFKKQKQWQPLIPKLLSEQKGMIYGTGEIGQTVAKVLSHFGVDVYGVSLSGKQKDSFKEVMTLHNHYEKLSEMDFLISTLPLTKETSGLFDEKIFNPLSDAAFINVGRGASLNEEALLAALEKQKVKFAVLDVFKEEPLPKKNQLWSHPNVFITPHISAVTTPEEGVDCFLDTLKRIDEDHPLANVVDTARGY